jgi:hypothetical protein
MPVVSWPRQHQQTAAIGRIKKSFFSFPPKRSTVRGTSTYGCGYVGRVPYTHTIDIFYFRFRLREVYDILRSTL